MTGVQCHSRKCRGALMFGMAALILILGMICGTILLRSLDAYHASARAEMRLQARAAAEGAVVLLQSAPDRRHEPAEIGPCRIGFDAPETNADGIRARFTVAVLRGAGRSVMETAYVARFAAPAPGQWRFTGLETAR